MAIPPLTIDRSLYFIDQMWHVWILDTRSYRQFCERQFGFYVDHAPKSARHSLEGRPAASDSGRFDREIQYSYIYDKLGAETLERWYELLCDRYWDLPHRRIPEPAETIK